MCEFRLPNANGAEISLHIADFLARQRDAVGETERALVRPDALLFNSGALEPA